MRMSHRFAKYILSVRGTVAVLFGLSLPLVVTAVGLSVDVGQSYLVKERLSHALDAAALAAASNASEDPAVVEQRVNDFLEVNYPPDKIGYTIDVNVESNKDTLDVSATAQLDTSFMRVFGHDKVLVDVEAQVTKQVKSIEVVLVMDVTGSMATKTKGVTRLQSLKDAANLFIDTMFTRVRDKNQIKIGLVPFSASVNVGSYGLGKTPAGHNYSSAFIRNPHNFKYYDYTGANPTATQNLAWWGCILEGPTPTDTQDHAGPWDMYRYCRRVSDDKPVCDTTRSTTLANVGCTKATVMPMTNNKTELKSNINSMIAEGNTYINVGLVWGERMISPEFPFEEGVSWQNDEWKKAVILMTDGVNEPNSVYSAYGRSTTAGITVEKLNNRMLDVCEDLKEKGVLLYTITFDKGVNRDTKDLFKECATQPSMWYDAPDGDTLEQVYLTIAKELANLHLSK